MSRRIPHRPLLAEALEDRYLLSASAFLFKAMAVPIVLPAVSAPADNSASAPAGDQASQGTNANTATTPPADGGITDAGQNAGTVDNGATTDTGTNAGQDATLADNGTTADTGTGSTQGLTGDTTGTSTIAVTNLQVTPISDVKVVSLGTGRGKGHGGGTSSDILPPEPGALPPHGQEPLILPDGAPRGLLPPGGLVEARPNDLLRPEGGAGRLGTDDGARASAQAGGRAAHDDAADPTDKAAPAAAPLPVSPAPDKVATAALERDVAEGTPLLDLVPGASAVLGVAVGDWLGRVEGLGEHLASDGGSTMAYWVVAGALAVALAESGRRYYLRRRDDTWLATDRTLAYFPELL
jgi:hypothetical protein